MAGDRARGRTGGHLIGWQRIEPILDRALDLPPADRGAYLDAACAGDAPLRARIAEMIRQGEDPNGPLEHSLLSVAGPLLLGLADPSPSLVAPGDVIGPWRLVRELGHGGMGVVFLAERDDGHFAQTAALKLIRRGREHDPLLIRRFLEERRILAALSHPNIARLLDGGVTGTNLPWFAMEYVAGQPLDQYCHSNRLDIPARLLLMEQVLGAVSYAHRNLLVHRDLKPGNIFVTETGDVKLLDFGIAKLLGDEPSAEGGMTLAQGRVMTPEFAAPEQVRGEPVTTATDIYALGAVLYELLTGKRAHRFTRNTAAEIERVVCDTEPETPSHALRSGSAAPDATDIRRGPISSELDTIVLKALQKDPARRYASAEAMLEDLRRFRSGRPLLARPDSLRYRWAKFIGRHRLAVGAGAVIVLAIAGGVVATVWQARAARLQAARAERVKEFLVDLLHQADPDITKGQDFTVRQLLDRGTHRVDSLLAKEPAVQAELYEVLGNTYSHLGLTDQADSLHRKGLAASLLLYGPGSEEVLDLEMAVGWGLNDQGRYRDADTLLIRSIQEYQRAGGKQSQALSDALDILATARKRLEHPVEAESLYRLSLAMQIRLTGPNDTITASRLGDLASLLGSQNRLEPAESALAAAQAHRRGVLPALDVRYLAGESGLATLLMKRGDLKGADPRLTTAVSGMAQIEAPGGLNWARTLDRLALLQSLELRTQEAIATATKATMMFASVMGDRHPETLNSRSLLAGYQASAGRIDIAEPLARSALSGLQEKMGERHDLTLAAEQRLALIELAAGSRGEAVRAASEVIAAVRQKYSRITPAFALSLGVIAAANAEGGERTGADSLFRQSLLALQGGTYVDSAALPLIAARYATFLEAQGRGKEAAAFITPALSLLPASTDSSNVVVMQLRKVARKTGN